VRAQAVLHRRAPAANKEPDPEAERHHAGGTPGDLKLNCSLPAIHYVLRDLDLTFKKNVARQRARARRRGKSQSRMDGRAKPA
jgi:hypothetical protein